MTTKKIMVILEAGPTAPEWFQLLEMGTKPITVSPGEIKVDQQALSNIIGAWKHRGNDLVIDYEHQTLSGEVAPAAGWIKDLETRPDGLWARAEWTDKAAAFLTNREYRYFSPVMNLDQENRPTELLNAALTNFPAMTQCPPLVAKCREGLTIIALSANPADKTAQAARAKKYGIGVKDGGNVSKPGKWSEVPEEQWGDPVNYAYPMPDKVHARDALSRWGDPSNQAQYEPAERSTIQKRITSRAQALGIKTTEDKSMPMTKMKGVLGLTAEAQETEVLAAVEHIVQQGTALKGVVTKALGLKAEATAAEITTALAALKGDQTKLTSLTDEVAALKDREATREAEGLVEVALKAGKLLPAERDLMIADAKRDPEGFKARVALRPQIVPVGQNLGVLKDGGQGADGEPGPEAPVDRRIAFKAQKLADEKKIGIAAAQELVLKENPELAREYKQSFQVDG